MSGPLLCVQQATFKDNNNNPPQDEEPGRDSRIIPRDDQGIPRTTSKAWPSYVCLLVQSQIHYNHTLNQMTHIRDWLAVDLSTRFCPGDPGGDPLCKGEAIKRKKQGYMFDVSAVARHILAHFILCLSQDVR